MDKLEGALAQIQTLVTTLRSGIADVRAGVTGAIDNVSATANLLTEEIQRAGDVSAQVDSSLAALEALSVRLQQAIPGILVIIAVILSLIFIFNIHPGGSNPPIYRSLAVIGPTAGNVTC